MIKTTRLGACLVVLGCGFALVGCGDGTGNAGDGDNSGDGDGDSNGSGDGDGDGDDDSNGSSDGDGDSSGGLTIHPAPQIPGGGENSAPLAPGCGPDTAQQCIAPGGGCNSETLIDQGKVEVIDAGATCFFGEEMETPSATVEYITESIEEEEYVHLRVVFDPDFVDTVYGACSVDTGWKPKGGMKPPKDDPKMPDAPDAPDMPDAPAEEEEVLVGHTFKDLVGSDHVELMLYNCDDELSMHMKVDFLDDKTATTECGYATAGVSGGEGEMFVGDASDVLAVGTSLDRNMNGCGYCELENSPCPSGDNYEPSTEAPEWDFRMVYELWIKRSAFGSSGFCRPDVEYVHASPAKADVSTVLVEPGECPPPPPGEECPVDFELFLSSEGEFICGGPPDEDGKCPDGYEIDLTSEGELCIPEGEQ